MEPESSRYDYQVLESSVYSKFIQMLPIPGAARTFVGCTDTLGTQS